MRKNNRILIRGGDDLVSGMAARLHRAGCDVLVKELVHPLVVRYVGVLEALVSKDAIRSRIYASD